MAASGRYGGRLLQRVRCPMRLVGSVGESYYNFSRTGAPCAGIHRIAFAYKLAVAVDAAKWVWPPSGAWREALAQGKSQPAVCGYLRRASTHQPSGAAPERQKEYEKQSPKNDREEAKVGEEMVDEKMRMLRAALAHVPTLGWTEAALAAGAEDVGFFPAFARAFPRGEAALVEFFMDDCTQALVEELESHKEELAKLVLRDRIATILWMRLEMQIPYMSTWAQALGVQANPLNLPMTLKQRALLIDVIWHAAGARSADMDWYAKRAVLAGAYSTTELYLLTDASSGFTDSRAFLNRQINDKLDCQKSIEEAGNLAEAVSVRLQVSSSLKNSGPPSSSASRL